MNLVAAVLSVLYPARCCACDAACGEGAAFCEPCGVSLLPIAGGKGFWYGGALADALKRLKYDDKPELAQPLARLLPRVRAADADLIVPVPLHPRRLRERTFNQAAVLAIALPRDVPVDVGALARVRDTPPQTSLGPEARSKNMKDAFRARPGRVRGRRVLLVDDVLTTGATASACARTLALAGAAEVHVLTVARAMP